MANKAVDRRQKRRAHAQATTGKHRTAGQTAAFNELREIVDKHPSVLSAVDLNVAKGQFSARVRIATADMMRTASGLQIASDHEDVELCFGDSYPDRPPCVMVHHDRFLGYPHVLVGRVLCIYLDVDREWHPALGVSGVIARLIDWFSDAAADRFDGRTALFHPIGGLPPSPHASGMLVVRPSLTGTTRHSIARATIDRRTSRRSDLIRWGNPTVTDPSTATPALVLRTSRLIARSLLNVNNLGELVDRIERAGGPTATAALEASARLMPHAAEGTVHLVVDVAHPNEETLTYIACAIAAVPRTMNAALSVAPADLRALPIGWIAVSDERNELTTRRDSQRPTASFKDKSIELWGCGGLGSWMAEFIVRAGARRIVLRDSGAVSGGLLVRQNYTEHDVGMPKTTQLAARLKSIADDVEVEHAPSNAIEVLAAGFTSTADLLIDATINVTVAARLDEWARATPSRPLIAQVATDPRSATLGMLIVASPELRVGPATIDDATWAVVRDDAAMETFHGFWTPLAKADQLVPALGCSTPTFHGSAADLASIAGSLVSVLAGHIGVSVSGTHLIESSHARGAVGGGHFFVRFAEPV